MTFEEIAAQLGADGADWAIDRLHRYAPLVGHRTKGYNDFGDRLAFEGALYLRDWLCIEAEAYERLGEDCPECVDEASRWLDELLPLIADCLTLPSRRGGGGPTPDNRRRLCANICAGIWREFHDSAGSNSDTLLGSCEAYWQACGQPPTAADLSGHLRNWKWFLASNSHKKPEVR